MNIQVSNFSTEINEEELKGLFAPYGEVESVTIAMDSFTDRSRGFGFIEMPNEEEAKAAITALNKTKVGDQTILVQEAAPSVVHKGSYKIGEGMINVYKFRKN